MNEETLRIYAEEARQEARRLFQRTLALWVGDILALKRAGLDRPTYREARARHAHISRPLRDAA